jgi:hypothetical protein
MRSSRPHQRTNRESRADAETKVVVVMEAVMVEAMAVEAMVVEAVTKVVHLGK